MILGSTGLLGQELVYYFSKQEEISLVVTTRSGSTGIYSNEIALDLNDPNELKEVLSLYRPNVVLNASGVIGFKLCENNPKHAEQINLGAVKNILDNLHENQIFVQYSTNAVFGHGEGNYKENDKKVPQNIYGKTKSDAEDYALTKHENSIIIRTCDVFGEYRYSKRNDRLLHVICKTLASGNSFDAYENIYSTPTYICDIPKVTHELLDKKFKGVIHVAGKDVLSRFEFVQYLARKKGLDVTLINKTIQADSNYASHSTLNTEKLESLGITTTKLANIDLS